MRVQKISAFSDGFADVIVRRFKTVRGAVAALVFRDVFRFNDYGKRHGADYLFAAWLSGTRILRPKKVSCVCFCYAKCCRQSRRYADSVWKSAKYLSLLLFSFSAPEFFKVMAAPFAVAFVLIFLSCLFVKPIEIEAVSVRVPRPPLFRTVAYSALFAVSVLMVFRVFPYWWGLAAVVAALCCLILRACSRWTTSCF